MITFNTDKEKRLKFDLNVQGIKSQMLEYYIRLSSDTTDFGIKGNLLEDNILEFIIPPLGDIIKESKLDAFNKIKIEVHDKENKYYLKPMEDSIVLEKQPRADVTITEQNDKGIELNLSINEELDNGVKAPKSKIRKFLN